MNTEKKVVNEYRLYVNGLFGRNRKVKGEGFAICETPENEPLTNDELTIKVNEVIAREKIKSGRVKVYVSKVTETKYDGYTERLITLFGAETLRLFNIGETK